MAYYHALPCNPVFYIGYDTHYGTFASQPVYVQQLDRVRRIVFISHSAVDYGKYDLSQ